MKHNDAVIRQYCQAVGKRLPLPAAQRRQLLNEAAQELLSGIAPERVQAYQKKLHRRYLLAAVLIVVIVCCAALIYAQVMMDSSVAYAEEHITILPTTDLSAAGQ